MEWGCSVFVKVLIYMMLILLNVRRDFPGFIRRLCFHPSPKQKRQLMCSTRGGSGRFH